MTVLDASALVGYLAGEPNAKEVRKILAAGNVAMTTINLAEALDQLERSFGQSPAELEAAIDLLRERYLQIIPVDLELAKAAGHLRALEYRRRSSPLSLADCVLICAAAAHEGNVATSDTLAMEVTARYGVGVHRLKDSLGRIRRGAEYRTSGQVVETSEEG